MWGLPEFYLNQGYNPKQIDLGNIYYLFIIQQILDQDNVKLLHCTLLGY